MSCPPVEPIMMTILSDPAAVAVARAAAEKLCGLIGFSDKAASEVILSLDEALCNIIKHAYGGVADKPIEIEMTPIGSGPDGVRIRLTDKGRWVDPSRIKSRDLEDVRPGGLGVHIMKQCMDSVEFTPAETGGTVLTMVKMIHSTESPEADCPAGKEAGK